MSKFDATQASLINYQDDVNASIDREDDLDATVEDKAVDEDTEITSMDVVDHVKRAVQKVLVFVKIFVGFLIYPLLSFEKLSAPFVQLPSVERVGRGKSKL